MTITTDSTSLDIIETGATALPVSTNEDVASEADTLFSMLEVEHQVFGATTAFYFNIWLCLTGAVSLVQFIASIFATSLLGPGAPIGVIVCSIFCCIAGLIISCGTSTLAFFEFRAGALFAFSLASLVCAIVTYSTFHSVEACAVLAHAYDNTDDPTTFKYYGDSTYFEDAAVCLVKGDGQYCNCVDTRNNCFTVTLLSKCSPIIDRAPGAVLFLLITSIVVFFMSFVASAVAGIFYQRYKRILPSIAKATQIFQHEAHLAAAIAQSAQEYHEANKDTIREDTKDASPGSVPSFV